MGSDDRENSEARTCLGIGRGDPDAIRILDDVLAKRAVKKKKARGQNALSPLERGEKTRRALSNCTDVIIGAHEELLEEQTRIRELAGEEGD